MISIIFSLAMVASPNSIASIPSNCTKAPVVVTRQRDISTRTSLADPFVFFETDNFRFTLGREDTFNLLKARVDHSTQEELQVRVLVFLLSSMPTRKLPNDVTGIWPDQSQLTGNERQLAADLEHEIVVLFLRALREGSAIVERTSNHKQVAQLNVQMYEAPNVQGVRFVTSNQSAFDYCHLITE